MKLDSETIGKLCRDTECGDGWCPLEVRTALPGNHSEALGAMTRIAGELYEELGAARGECDDMAVRVEQYAGHTHARMRDDYKKWFPAAGAKR